MTRYFLLLLLIFFSVSCAGKHTVVGLKAIQNEKDRTLFIAFDGISYSMMKRMKDDGYFKDFQEPIPLVMTFPSVTTLGFSALFKELGAGKTYGPEIRFYSYNKNKIVGGTPFDIKKYPIAYKHYFDTFRNTVFEKGVMYSFPGVAGKQDLMRTKKILHKSDKKVLMTYLGGTDGSQHMLGEMRTERFMHFASDYIHKMKADYKKKTGKDYRTVIFSDHGFHFDKLKNITGKKIGKALRQKGYKLSPRIQSDKDVVLVRFGLLNGGVSIADTHHAAEIATLVSKVEGMDIVIWPDKNKIYLLNDKGEKAYFEYEGQNSYRYVTLHGDPLLYKNEMKQKGMLSGVYYSQSRWYDATWDAYYPDVGFRLYDTFYNLVQNPPRVMFSLKPNYQFGSWPAYIGTKLKFGQKGTHGGLFKEVSYGVAMTDNPNIKMPHSLRYNQFFNFFIPQVVRANH
ncbi:alkaline phosphatase family protein [bacterium]|nr:alkaline phosphatase family protein [bacterium]